MGTGAGSGGGFDGTGSIGHSGLTNSNNNTANLFEIKKRSIDFF
jgi:hypothetical protein